MTERERELETLRDKHERLGRAVEILEKERNRDRSPETKANLVDLKKQKLKVKDQIRMIEAFR